jgi:serine phosphatase RsbU (regulator of sigma subunit)/PAS domain-containing protein
MRSLALLSATDDDLPEAQVLRLALREVVAEVGGLGGLVHLRESATTSALHLAASTGLPPAVLRRWQEIPDGAGAAPAAAARLGRPVWFPTPEGPGVGMASVPLATAQGEPFGALTVVTATVGEPTARQWDVQRAVASWAACRLRHAEQPRVLPRPRGAPDAAEPPPGVPHPPEPPGTPEPQGTPELPAETGFQQAFSANQVGGWIWYPGPGVLHFDEPALALLGVDRDAYDGHIKTWIDLVHPEDISWVTAEVDKAVATLGPYDAEYRVCRPDGTTRWVQARGRVEPDARGNPYRMLGTLWDTTESHLARDRVRSALRYMSDGFLSLDEAWRITFANVRAERLLGSPGTLVGRVLWDLLVIRRVPGLESRCRDAAARMRPTVFEAEWPDTGRWYRFRFVPVPDGLAWYFTDITESRKRRAEQAAAERAATERAARIQDLTAALAEAVTSMDVVAAVAERVLPPFGGSGLTVQVVEGDRLRVIGAVGYPQPYVDMIAGPMSKFPQAAEALRTHTPWFISSPRQYAKRFPQAAGSPKKSGKQAWAFMPLVVYGRLVGLCVISFDRPRRLTGAERALLIALSGLIAQALERARLFDAEHAQAQALQRTLLPQALPPLPAVTAAARYLPAGVSVGGDWYDVIPLSADRVALVIGDVMGHGLPEAVIMGRLRTAVQTLSDLELPPDEILGHLNDLMNGLGDDTFATCLYAIYDPVTRICTFARAGHPPPAMVWPDGGVCFAQSVPDPPLGVAEPPFEVVELLVPEHGLLVLYTDGLIESAHVDTDAGMSRLAELLQIHHGESLDQLCESLTRGLLPAGQQSTDDTALLVARVHATAPDAIATWSLPEEPLAARAARQYVRDQLAAWHLEELAMNTESLASELVANVIRHAHGPIRLRLLRSRTLVCEVFDGSATIPRIRRASWSDEGGRGLQLVTALCDRWGTRYMTTGKCIWTEQSLPLPAVRRACSAAGAEPRSRPGRLQLAAPGWRDGHAHAVVLGGLERVQLGVPVAARHQLGVASVLAGHAVVR